MIKFENKATAGILNLPRNRESFSIVRNGATGPNRL
jgi:hypothetical protein